MARYDQKIQEEELKLRVAEDWFSAYDTRRIIGKVDFCVAIPATELGLFEAENALWAEAKAGVRKDIHESFVQLILTIGRARTFDHERPPIFLGAFDAEKIAFLPFTAVQDVFAQNDFNWNVAPSNHETKEFSQLHALAEKTIAAKSLLFNFESDEQELRKFIKANFKSGRKDVSRIQIDKNNFTHIYRKWREHVLPHIDAPWETLKKKYSLYDRDFYLAELNVDDNGTADISDDKVASEFYITFNAHGQNRYRVQRKNADELSIELTFGFKSEAGLAAYAAFWGRYKRPPRKDYWNYIVKRLDLLVPQDVRERKGAFFTPQKWVELSQEYLAKELGENWQDEYDIWDCCAGTGNMEAGLTNKYKVWASTLDQQDVDVMKERIRNGANLLESHVFQFDFLNDSFDDLPEGLRQIINDPERRKKLVIYINPPYAEHSNRKVIVGTGDNRTNVAKLSKVHTEFLSQVGPAVRELYVQFFLRIYRDVPGAFLGSFSTLKFVCSQNCRAFRSYWRASFRRGFICPADTFDNVNGEFPIAFTVWRLCCDEEIKSVSLHVMERDTRYVGEKSFYACESKRMISDWLRTKYDPAGSPIGYLALPGVSMQQRASMFLTSKPTESDVRQHKVANVTSSNIIPCCVYLAVRHCIAPEWTNNKDEFRFPLEDWEKNSEFKGDCLVWSLFDNAIKSEHGPNHWIPFAEDEVGAQDCFASHFMGDFLKGKIKAECGDLFSSGDRNVAAPTDCVAPRTSRPAALDYYRSYELGKTWYDVADPRDVLSLTAIEITDVDRTADRRSLKDIFRRMMPVRNLSDGRLVCFPVAAAKKLRLLREINVPGIAHAFGRLLAHAIPAWSEREADIPNHKRHRNAYVYHHYISKVSVDGGEYYVRFAVREDVSAGTRNELHDAIISNIVIYKAKGAELSDPGLSRVEGSTPFVDNKIALFLSAVNGGAENDKNGQTGFVISMEARAVLDAGRELWRYYHAQPGANPNAAYYDIRKFFQGVKVDAKGKEKMNATSGDRGYNERLAALKAAMKDLAAKIEPKVYEYGFLKK